MRGFALLVRQRGWVSQLRGSPAEGNQVVTSRSGLRFYSLGRLEGQTFLGIVPRRERFPGRLVGERQLRPTGSCRGSRTGSQWIRLSLQVVFRRFLALGTVPLTVFVHTRVLVFSRSLSYGVWPPRAPCGLLKL